jgi:hypothetical protein
MNEKREPTQTFLFGDPNVATQNYEHTCLYQYQREKEMKKRWLPEHLSTQIYQCLREIYPYEKKIIGKHPVKVIEMEGMFVIQLYDDRGYMQDISILTHKLTALNMTRKLLVLEFFRLMKEALDTQDRQRNGERK